MERQEGAMAWWPPEAAACQPGPTPDVARRMLLGAGLMAAVATGIGVCSAGGLPSDAKRGGAAAATGSPGPSGAPASLAPATAGAAPAAVAPPAAPATAIPPSTSSRGASLFPPLLAQDWPTGRDPAGWLVSEKLDGVRALWDGQRMVFRSGRALALPAAIRERLPREPLDGELWLGRGRFEDISALLRSERVADADAWRGVQ